VKFAVISPDKAQGDEIAAMLESEPSTTTVTRGVSAGPDLAMVVNGSTPDVLVCALSPTDLQGLARLGQISSLHPAMAVVVLCDGHSAEFLLQAMRVGVREVLPSRPSKEALLQAVGRLRQTRELQAKHAGQILAFISCKGGSGATFLATNLAYALGQANKRTIVIDLNLQFGDASLFVSGDKAAMNLGDIARQIQRLDASLLASSLLNVGPNCGVLAAPDDPTHSIDVHPDHIDTILRLARQQYDFIILDVGRSLEAVSVKALDMADTIFPVLQLTLPFIRDGKRLLNLFRNLDYPREKIKLILNRHEKKTATDIRLEDLEQTMGMKIFRAIPNSYDAVAASVNQGVPIIKLNRGNAVSKSLLDLAVELTRAEAKRDEGWVSRVFGRA
jgi:pilus assembly protein CpaE